MTIRTRLQRLEIKARRLSSPEENRGDTLSDEDRLERFEAWGEEGHFAREPDFSTALAFYREAMERAKRRTDSPFDPPDDFLPNLMDSPYLRLVNWRNKVRFPDVHAGWEWLMELLRRVQEGLSPVSIAEFEELASWFQTNDSRLYQMSLPSQLLELGDGRCTSVANIRYGLWKGRRVSGAGELADDLRWLQACYGGEPT